MRLRLSLALLLAASTFAAPPALAQPKPDAAKPDAAKPDASKAPPAKSDPRAKPDPREEAAKILAKQAEARLADLVKRGTEACERGELDEGLTLLNAAMARKMDADILGAVAACEAKGGQWAGAADHYAAALRLKEEGPERKPLEEAFAEARKRVGAVTVTVNVEGADVIVGDRVVGQTPLPGEVFVEAGKSTPIIVKRAGYEEAQRRVEVAAQRSATLKIDLVATSSNGNRYASSNRTKVPFFVLGGAALVAGGVGAALYASAASKAAAADDLLLVLQGGNEASRPCDKPASASIQQGCATLRDTRASRDQTMNIGTGFLIGGGVLLGAAVITGVWAFSGSSASTTGSVGPRAASLSFAPVVSPDGAGLWMRGAF